MLIYTEGDDGLTPFERKYMFTEADTGKRKNVRRITIDMKNGKRNLKVNGNDANLDDPASEEDDIDLDELENEANASDTTIEPDMEDEDLDVAVEPDETEEELKIEEKPSEEKVEKAKNITALLKKISEDDSAFNGVVELFSKIETLAQKHGGNYDYALKAINDRLRLKKKED